VIDTLTKYIGYIHKTELPSVKFEGIELSDKPRGTDFDIGVLLNLIFPLPATTLAYPVVSVSESGVEQKLSALVVADSYWVNIEQEAASRLFGKDEFWYYNSKVYPYVIDDQNPVYIDKSNLKKKLEEFDVILLMSSEINLHCMFWNFIDEAYKAYNPGEKEDPVYAYENNIKNHREWFRFVVGKAQSEQRSVERMIRLDAAYMYNLENKNQ
jgi:hypothetical protein